MAGRKNKNTVDYFPHYCTSGKTLYIIESKYGHLGYSIWFKTLELLGTSENHYIDLREDTDLLYLISKLKITEEQFNDIYNLLAKLDAIDSFLWSEKIIFSENFTLNIGDAYKRRDNKCMSKLDLCEHLSIKCIHKLNKGTHKYTKKSKEKEIKEKKEKYVKYKDFTDKLLLDYFPNIKVKSLDLQYKVIRDLVEIDKYTSKQIIKAVANGRKDEFWYKTFLSLSKLRKVNDKFDSTHIEIFLNLTSNEVKEHKPTIKYLS